jgi:hypothetical protein
VPFAAVIASRNEHVVFPFVPQLLVLVPASSFCVPTKKGVAARTGWATRPAKKKRDTAAIATIATRLRERIPDCIPSVPSPYPQSYAERIRMHPYTYG